MGVLVLLGRRWWLRRARLALVGLFRRKEAVASGVKALVELFGRLAEADERSWLVFVSEPDSEERRAVAEIAHRLEVAEHELATRPLPMIAHEVADDLQRLAGQVGGVLTKMCESMDSDTVIDAITGLDIGDVVESLARAEEELQRLLEAFDVGDPAVYGGGMYI